MQASQEREARPASHWDLLPPLEVERTPALETLPAAPSDSSGDSKDDPMVSEAIWPFTIKSGIVVPRTVAQGDIEAIIDTRCTQCLISLPTVQKLGITTMPLVCLICFEHVDGTLIGGASATLVTELVRLEIGHHWELSRFVVAPKMMQSVILRIQIVEGNML